MFAAGESWSSNSNDEGLGESSFELWSSLHSFSKKGRSQVDLQDQVCQTESLTEDVALRKNGKFKM